VNPFYEQILSYIFQGIIAVGVGWVVHKQNENTDKLVQVHTLVNSRSAAQDTKIAGLENKVDDLVRQLSIQSTTLAVERASQAPKVS
jgi:hypothetical protein